jgi:hypothetical protein
VVATLFFILQLVGGARVSHLPFDFEELVAVALPLVLQLLQGIGGRHLSFQITTSCRGWRWPPSI